MVEQITDEVHVDWGKLLETQLEKWRGGGSHARGIAEYITNSDDSYRRLRKFKDQTIHVEIHSSRGRKIDKLIIRDSAEGMSSADLETRFFKYFESFSGREQGEPVSGRFGTGGKAYAIMNFEHCWITSVKDGLESKAWFRWDLNRKRIIRGYDRGGYESKKVNKPCGTIIELQDSIKVNYELMDFIANLEKLARIRHVLKNQKVTVRLRKKNEGEEIALKYVEPQNPLKVWEFIVPSDICCGHAENPKLILRYFQQPLSEHSFIDLSDGISSVADLKVEYFDGRPFSRYFNGSLTLVKLRDSSAVKENRKGLEEGDDLTEAIESLIKVCVSKAVSEVEEEQRKKEKERRLSESNEKMKELSKFLKKCDMNFRQELKALKKRAINIPNEQITDEDLEDEGIEIYRRPTEEDPRELLVQGRWIISPGTEGGNGHRTSGIPQFIPDAEGLEFAIKIGTHRSVTKESKKTREGLRVIMSDDPNIPEADRRIFGEFDDPVSDRDMKEKGIIWINANYPLIAKRREKSDNDPVFLEMAANYVLMIVAQSQAQKQYDTEPEDEKPDPILLFREKFFKLQRELREDTGISYFEPENMDCK